MFDVVNGCCVDDDCWFCWVVYWVFYFQYCDDFQFWWVELFGLFVVCWFVDECGYVVGWLGNGGMDLEDD